MSFYLGTSVRLAFQVACVLTLRIHDELIIFKNLKMDGETVGWGCPGTGRFGDAEGG